MFRTVLARVPGAKDIILSAHCHDDLGLAVANTLAAIEADVLQEFFSVARGVGKLVHGEKLTASASARHVGQAITDYPPPKTNVPEAAVAYAKALRAMRGGLGILARERETQLEKTTCSRSTMSCSRPCR